MATSADDATTVAMRPFLTAAPWLAALGALVLDAVPVGIACIAPEMAGLGALWLSGGGLSAAGYVVTLGVLVTRALLELAAARLWTRVYTARTREEPLRDR